MPHLHYGLWSYHIDYGSHKGSFLFQLMVIINSIFNTSACIMIFILLPNKFRFDVALLASMPSPVLALQHVVVPVHTPSKGTHFLDFMSEIKNTAYFSLEIKDPFFFLNYCIQP